jgi:hypothetical protein
MTKSPHKLVLRKETLRALNTVDLARVFGGDGSGAIPLAADRTHVEGGCPLQADTAILSK